MHLSLLLQVLAWVVASAWTAKFVTTAFGLKTVPRLLLPEYDRMPDGMPTLTVVVPARNEAADILACIRSLLDQDYPALEVIAVDDRSTDATGDLLDQAAQANPGRLRVLHVTNLPAGWLGKTHAMAMAAAQSSSDFLLFTDADILFAPDSLRRSLVCATRTGADHLVTLPTTIIRRWDEAALLGFIQMLGAWAVRLWRVPDPQSRDALGVGAFNLIRRTAYLQTGGWEALRMEIVEDVGLGRRVKAAGFRSGTAFGRDLVRVHWASGTAGLVGVMTKNIFSAFRFESVLLLGSCAWLAGFAVMPFAGLFWWPTLVPAALVLCSVLLIYRLFQPHSGISPWNALLTPVAAVVFIYALLNSMAVTLRDGGVRWRGTFYPLAELRAMAAPLPSLRRKRRVA